MWMNCQVGTKFPQKQGDFLSTYAGPVPFILHKKKRWEILNKMEFYRNNKNSEDEKEAIKEK